MLFPKCVSLLPPKNASLYKRQVIIYMHGWRQTGLFLYLTFFFSPNWDKSHICRDKGVYLSWKEADKMDRTHTMMPQKPCHLVCFVYNTTAPQDKGFGAAKSDECVCWT